MTQTAGKQNITVALSRETIRKARVLAAKRSTSISGLLADQIESLTGEDEAYERAKRSAVSRLAQPPESSSASPRARSGPKPGAGTSALRRPAGRPSSRP